MCGPVCASCLTEHKKRHKRTNGNAPLRTAREQPGDTRRKITRHFFLHLSKRWADRERLAQYDVLR